MKETSEWLRVACTMLLQYHQDNKGWGYGSGGHPSVEPTVLSCLALLAIPPTQRVPGCEGVLAQSLQWVARLQQRDGSVGLSEELPGPKWPTSYALLLWSNAPGYEAHRDRATVWLEDMKARTYLRVPENPVAHDTSLNGWPWIEGVHPFVEPTALAILALCRSGHRHSARVSTGLRLLRDRAISTGGWNYGNNRVFSTMLRPQLGPSGLALLALRCGEVEDPVVVRAIEYVMSTLSGALSAQSLCWALLGLAAWGRHPVQAMSWITSIFQTVSGSDLAPYHVAQLILASQKKSVDLLGATFSEGDERHD